MSDGSSHEKRVYHSERPIEAGKFPVRLLPDRNRAGRIIADCDAGELRDFVRSVVTLGCLTCITQTSDGGAVSITVLDGQYRHKAYARTANEILVCYHDLLTAIRGEE